MAQPPAYPPGPPWPRPHFPPAGRPPSGLFPAPRAVRHPVYREAHPVRAGAVAAGAGGAALWMLLFALVGGDLSGYAWWSTGAAVVAWLAALLLVWRGDRGVAVGVAIATAGAWSVAVGLVVFVWSVSGEWPMW
ncbi:hypothetical protein [Melissospora conviva]|uniref:hypothetical protein n=1 Tax=Melissospora conviva TaxID=3388432 RepID=UPI003B8122FC